MKRYIIEGMGTFFLTLAVCLSGQPLGVGLMLMAMIYMGGHISGGHFNPAVSLAMFLQGELSTHLMAAYILVQSAGSFLAATLYHLLSEATFFPAPAQQVLAWEAITIEALLTFVFCGVIIAVTQKKAARDEFSHAGLIIGLVLTALIFTGGDISGCVLNPAIGIGTILFDVMKGGDSLHYLTIYLTGPFLGSIAASFFYQYLNSTKD